jgi:hypothetical protein
MKLPFLAQLPTHSAAFGRHKRDHETHFLGFILALTTTDGATARRRGGIITSRSLISLQLAPAPVVALAIGLKTLSAFRMSARSTAIRANIVGSAERRD